MVRRLDARAPDFAAEFENLLYAKREAEEDVAAVVRGIVADLRDTGDAALLALTERFDRVVLLVQGQIVDSGTADELLQRQPLFREMVGAGAADEVEVPELRLTVG